MNKTLFRSMQEQMRPSEAARAALADKLESTKRRTVPLGRYAAIAACLAAVIAAVPVYRTVRDWHEWQVIMSNFHHDAVVEMTKPHSYVLADGAAAESSGVDTGAGDQNQNMTPDELTDNLLEAGFTREDADSYLASGWQMTWAKWWKFYHQSEETGDRTLEALLGFSREEGLAVNTGEAPDETPGGAYVGDMPDQSEAVRAYQNLMAQFEADYGPDRYPEWYGGAYIDRHGGLIVNIVTSLDPGNEGDKTLYFQIQDWAGSSRIGFGGSEFSLNQLRELQENVIAAMEALGLDFGCGIDEEAGQVELTLPEAHEEALWQLAWLDPAGTAVHVVVARNAGSDALTEEPALTAPSVDHIIQPGGADPNAPVSDLPGVIVDEDGVIAYEPQG